jgi:transposase
MCERGIKLLYWDGQGFCLYYKVLERGRFAWPTASEGAARLTRAQLAMLWQGMDWRRPDWGAPPARVGSIIRLISAIYMAFITDF